MVSEFEQLVKTALDRLKDGEYDDGAHPVVAEAMADLDQALHGTPWQKLMAINERLLDALKALHSVHRAFSSNEEWTCLDDDARAQAETAIALAEGGVA